MNRMAAGFLARGLLAVVFLLGLAGAAGLSAIDIVFVPPTLGPASNQNAAAIQNELNRVFAEEAARYQSEVGNIKDNPQKMIGAFANSSVFSSTGASQRAFQGYDTFAITVGAMAGLQLPVSINSFLRDINYIGDRLFDDMNRGGDLQIGMNAQMVNAQVAINTSGFLLDGLYLGFKGGYMNLPVVNVEKSRLFFHTWSIGGTVNYQFIPHYRVIDGKLVWRGLSFGSGFIYQRTSLSLDVPIIPEGGSSGLANIGGTGARLDMGDPMLSFRFNIDTFTVPLEAVTSIRILGFLNFSLGGGVDIGFGSAAMRGSVDTEINAVDLPSRIRQLSPGRMSVSMGGSSSPTVVNPKIMTSFGFSAGPAIILDVPVTYYFVNNGYSVGVTFGVAM